MPTFENHGESFYKYAMEHFLEAGHISTSTPVFSNHSPEQFVFFDNEISGFLSHHQRGLFNYFDNVSHLFSVNNCVFLAVNLLTSHKERSQTAHDIHTLLHPIIGVNGTICIFHLNNEVLLSFMGYGSRCILSDWFLMNDDDRLWERLNIGNISIRNDADYFWDLESVHTNTASTAIAK